MRITGGDGRGVLYGVQECIDRARRNQAITPLTDGPHFPMRALRMWETPSNKVWCLPFESILDYEKMLRPEECPEYLDFARLLLAMRVNNLGLFPQYAARGSQFERWLSHAEPVEQFARFLDRFGVTVGLSLHYAEPDENGAYENVCPFSDVVQAQWHDFAARLADAMPSVRNAIVWGARRERARSSRGRLRPLSRAAGSRPRSGRHAFGQRGARHHRRRVALACGHRPGGLRESGDRVVRGLGG